MKDITKPIPPTAAIPIKHIFSDSQSSLREGFLAILSSREHEDRKDLKPMVNPTNSILIKYKNIDDKTKPTPS